MTEAASNPCLTCGACCAAYRVSFPWLESGDFSPGGVPAIFTRPLNHNRLVMLGTQGTKPHCTALDGEVGKAVSCSIHANRPSPCRAFTASWSDGTHHERCDEARGRYGLAPLTPEDWKV